VPPAAVVVPSPGADNVTNVLLDGSNHASGTGSVSSGGEVQWFTFRALTTHSFNVAASSSAFNAVLGLYAANGHRLAYSDNAPSHGTDPAAAVKLVAGTTYYLGVTDHPANAGGSFTWSIDGGVEADDVYESNNTPARATDLGTLSAVRTVTGLKLLDSADWFQFRTIGRGLAGETVSISFAGSGGDLDLYLYDASGRLVRSSTTGVNGESVGLTGLAAGTYRVKVVGHAGATNHAYTLTVNPRPTDDAYENNDARGAAYNLGTVTGTDTVSGLRLLDVGDWYKFTTVTAGTASNSVHIDFANASGNLNLALYNSAGALLGFSATTGDVETVSLNGRRAGTYYVRVFGAANPSYSLAVVAPTDWYSQNLRDAAVSSLVRLENADHTFSRADLLAVYSQVEQDGTVSTNEFADLKTIATTTYLSYSNAAYQYLAQQVVGNSPANATYNGATGLANLAAGSTGARLQQLVGEWFLGLDRPKADANGAYSYSAAPAAGRLFGASGPLYTDVVQGAEGDCYFLAALGETAKFTPSAIRGMFTDNGDGTYTVRFYDNGSPRYVTVDRYLPTDAAGHFVYAGADVNHSHLVTDPTNVLWVALAEKAYAEADGGGWVNQSGLGTYASVEGGYCGDSVAQVTGRAQSGEYFSTGVSDFDFNAIVNAFGAGKFVTFGTKTTGQVASNVVPDHAYFMLGYNVAAQTITVANPWGVNGGYNGASLCPGTLTLTISQLDASFDDWTWG
jgi:hypothetical protein